MGDLLIRNIPDDLRRGLAKAADAAGLSLSDTAKQVILAGLAATNVQLVKPPISGYEAIRQALGDNLPTESEHREFMQILEEGRRAPDRPVPEFE